MEAENVASFHSKEEDNIVANGAINGTSAIPQDEIDLAATRKSIPDGETLNKRVHRIWDVIAVGSILTFIADIASDLFVAALYFRNGDYSWFALTLSFVVLSSFTLQIFSAKWFHEDERREPCWTYLLHFLHAGPIVRYWRAFRSGWRTRKKQVDPNEYRYFLEEWRDICMLRLFEAYLESAPQLVLQLYILAYHRRVKTESDIRTVVTAVCSLMSLAWSIVAYTGALRDVMLCKVSLTGYFIQIMWRFFMLASRITAFVLFASVYGVWLFVAVGIHWLIMFLFLVTQYSTFCSDVEGNVNPCREVFYNGIVAFVYNFSFFNISEGRTRIKLVLYYTTNLFEASVFIALWFPYRALFGDVSYAAIGLVFGGFIIGIIFLIIYYQFYHPRISKKGLCYKKGENIRFEQDNSYMFTRFWCCCCEVRTIQKSKQSDNASHIENTLPCHTRNQQLMTKPENSGVLNLDFLPRHLSLERVPRLLSPPNVHYSKTIGREEVKMRHTPTETAQQVREETGVWI